MILVFGIKLNNTDIEKTIFPVNLKKVARCAQVFFILIFSLMCGLESYYYSGNTIFTLTRDHIKDVTDHKFLYFVSWLFVTRIIGFTDVYPRKKYNKKQNFAYGSSDAFSTRPFAGR